MARKAHILKGIKGSESKNNWIFFDSETRPYEKDETTEKHKLYLGVAQYYRLERSDQPQDEIVFKEPEILLDFIEHHTRQKTVTCVMAMNLAFDFTVCELTRLLKENGWTLKTLLVEGKVTIIKYRKDKKSLLFLDLFNFVKAPVKAIGKLVGMPKLDIDFDDTDDYSLTVYCRRDVEIIAKFMINYCKFVNDHDLGCLGSTTPSQAFNAYRHRFMKEPIYIHNMKAALELERASYFGGRTECNFIGRYRGNVYYVDVNSMYPYVMKENVFPTKLEYASRSGCSLKRLEEYLEYYCVIAEVQLETEEPAYPAKPEDKLIFPIGKFTTTLCSNSLDYALQHGHIKEVNKFAIYHHAPIFKDFVEYFYDMRLKYKAEKNGVYEQMVKLIMNSLYGKFGQRTREILQQESLDEIITEIMPVHDENGTHLYDQVVFGGDVFHHYVKETDAFNSFCAIASHVTDYARMVLYSMQLHADRRNVLYGDTDSLFLNKDGYKNVGWLLDNKELGKLKLEDTFRGIYIHGLKDYHGGQFRKVKGVKKRAEQLERNKFRQLQFPTFRGLIRQGITDHIPIKTVTKQLKREYDKGVVMSNGQVVPFRLDD